MPAAKQHCSAPSIEVETLMLNPRFASLTALTKSSAATRLSKTAATVVGASSPRITASKLRVVSRSQWDAAVNRVAEVHRSKRHRDLQELAQLRQGILVIPAFAAHRENHVIVEKTFGASEAMERVGHLLTTSATG